MNTKITPKAKHLSERPSKTRFIALWIGAIIVVIVALVGFQYYRMTKASAQRRAIFQEQQQALISGWKAQGLTDEQITQKLKDQRSQRYGGGNGSGFSGSGQRPQGGFSLFRLFGGGRRGRGAD